MPHPTKIATCCYCGTRAALVLAGQARHELACSACGAPLHEMKMLRRDRAKPTPAAVPHAHLAAAAPVKSRKIGTKRKKGKRKKSLFQRFAKEAFDVLEDLLD